MPLTRAIHRELKRLDEAEELVAKTYQMIASERKKLIALLQSVVEEQGSRKNKNSGPDSPEPPLLM